MSYKSLDTPRRAGAWIRRAASAYLEKIVSGVNRPRKR
jgi:hypothetical protein